MSLSWSRREALAGIGTAVSIPISGCSVFEESQELAHYVDIFNYGKTTHNFSILIKGKDENAISEWNIVLESETAEERAEKFTQTPDTISIAVDSEEPVRKSWPDRNCQEEGSVSAGGIEIRLTPKGNIQIEPTCYTIYAD